METKKPEGGAKEGSVRTLLLAPRARSVPPLTDAEILALRALLVNAEHIAESCPIARRVMSKR